MNKLGTFVIDYIERHKHPLNALLHLAGVPMVFIGIYWIFTGSVDNGVVFFVFGYFLQYLGHRAQGNEVGEVTLIKNIWRRLEGSRGSCND